MARLNKIIDNKLKAIPINITATLFNETGPPLLVEELAQALDRNRTQYLGQTSSTFQYIGIYTDKEAAEKMASVIHTKVRDKSGKRLF